MKSLIVLGAFTATFLQSKAQDSLYPKLFQNAIYGHRDNSTIVYLDSSFAFYGGFSRFAKAGKVEGFTDLRKGIRTYLRFSKSELHQIDKAFAQQKRIQWPTDLLYNSLRMPFDSIKIYTSYLGTPNFSKHPKYNYYYHLSQAVFLRNHSIAIFRIAEMIDPSAGYDFVLIYVKEPQGWARKMTIVAGAW